MLPVVSVCVMWCVISCLFIYPEVNLFWAAHQVHHSSQDYTLSTALRQSVMQRFSSWVGQLHKLIECLYYEQV